MKKKHRELAAWSTVVEPLTIEAYANVITFELFEQRLEVVAYFDLPDPQLTHPLKFVSRDPNTVAFHRRIFDALQKRHDAFEARHDTQEPNAA